jgi:hypothetical protein
MHDTSKIGPAKNELFKLRVKLTTHAKANPCPFPGNLFDFLAIFFYFFGHLGGLTYHDKSWSQALLISD